MINRAVTVLVILVLFLAGLGVGYATTDLDGSISGSAAPSETSSASPSPTDEGITAAGGGGGNLNNEVVVRNFTDGRFTNRVGSGIAHVTGDTVENQNAAAAVSSCISCRTVAVAVQVVLIQRPDAATIAPRNIAFALNQSCFNCETFAAAHQYVITTGSLVRFTSEGQRRLAGLENELRGLAATDGIAFPELDAQIDAVVAQMWAIVDSELVRIGARGPATAYEDSDFELGGSTPTETPTPTETDSPIADPSPEATEPERNSQTLSPSPSDSSMGATPEPSPSDT